jgi:acylglycerol lipase
LGSYLKIVWLQGGYHELHNEPDGVREKLAETIIAFVQEHASDRKESKAGTSSGPAESSETGAKM